MAQSNGTSPANPFGAGCPWHAAADLFGPPGIDWCEQAMCSWIGAPGLTFSNVGFFVAAVLLLVPIFPKGCDTCLARQFAVPVFAVFLGSFVYHASMNRFTQLFDFLGISSFFVFTALVNLQTLGIVESSCIAILFQVFLMLLLCLLAPLFTFVFGVAQLTVPLAAGLALVTYLWVACQRGMRHFGCLFWCSVAFIVVGSACSYADQKRLFPCSQSAAHFGFSGHAIWHMLAACGLFFLSWHHCAEDVNSEDAVIIDEEQDE